MEIVVRRLPGWSPELSHSELTELYHSGIKGQRKGVRRYQLPNGTYTAAGNQRYRPKKNVISRLTGINLTEDSIWMVGVGAAAVGMVLASGAVSLPAIGTSISAMSGKGAVSALLANEAFRNIVLPSIGAMSIANMVGKILDDD